MKLFYVPETAQSINDIVWVDDMDEFNKDQLIANGRGFGLATYELQVLRSAAGYYIGTLCKENWDGVIVWSPNYRDSDCYWEKLEDAQQALLDHNYPVKF